VGPTAADLPLGKVVPRDDSGEIEVANTSSERCKTAIEAKSLLCI
jgi:hypothetical protein